MSVDPTELRGLILSSSEPLLFKNCANSDLINFNLHQWKSLLQNEKLQLRRGTSAFTKEPQWERCTTTEVGTFEHFLKFVENERSDSWLYFDYKYLNKWFKNVEEIRKIDVWRDFGFPEVGVDDSTIWIGSKGAHTPCHMDTYGCNLILQLYGSKQWVMFPPEENLGPVRVPYEESSIYSKLNFFSPTINDFEGIKNCKKIILSPGDILLLPHHWWHYVENLETAISINVWLPLEDDHLQRLNESVVQLFIKQFTNDLTEEMKLIILNPNSKEDMAEASLRDLLDIHNKCIIRAKEMVQQNKRSKKDQSHSIVNAKVTETEVQTIIEKYSKSIWKIQDLTEEEFKLFLENQRKRFKSCTVEDENDDINVIESLINAVAHPQVISLITEKLLK